MTLESELTKLKRDVEKLKNPNEITEFLDEVILMPTENIAFVDTVSVTELSVESNLIGECRIGFFEAV